MDFFNKILNNNNNNNIQNNVTLILALYCKQTLKYSFF